MKQTTKRLLALLMAVVLCLGLTPVTAWAANFPSEFYASITFSSSSSTESFGTVTQSDSSLKYTKTGVKTDHVIYGMEYAGGAFFTVEGTRGRSVSQDGESTLTDDGWRELRVYNGDLNSYQVIGDVSPKDKPNYAIVDTAIDLSGEAPVLYGTYNYSPNFAISMICTIDLETAKPGNFLQVTGLEEDVIYAIAFDENGTLYAVGADKSLEGGQARLYTIDLENGKADLVNDIKSPTGVSISTNFAQDMAFDYTTDTLYWAENKQNDVYTLDTETATATFEGTVKYDNNAYALQSFCIPYDTAFADDQHMISVIYTGGGKVTNKNDDEDEGKTFYMVESGNDLTLALTPDKNGKLLSVKVDGESVSVADLTEYTFSYVTANHVIEVTFRDNLPVTQKNMTWFHYQGLPASFYTQHHAYKFYELPYTTDAPKDGYTQTLLDSEGNEIDDDTVILAGNYDVRVTHSGTDKYNALNVEYEDALQLGKCPGTPGRPVVYGKVGCTQGDLATTSALQDYYGTDGELIDAAHDEIPVTLVWLNPETTYNEVGNFYASATIYAADELDERLKACYTLDDGKDLTERCLISSRRTQVVVLPAEESSLIKVQASDDAGGTVSGKGVYKNDDRVTVTATVNSDNGYTFEGWQEDGQTVSTNATYTFTATGDRTLTALFTLPEKPYTVHLSVDPAGAGTVTGGGSYEEVADYKATVEATPNPGFYFIGWHDGDNLENANASYEITVPKDGIALTAKFGVDYLARAELAKENLASSLGTSVFEWSTLTQAVDAYEKAVDFVSGIVPAGVVDPEGRFETLTNYYNSVDTLDLSNQGLGNEDLKELYLFTGVTDLNLSGNKGVTSLTNLPDMANLEALNLGGTDVTDLNCLSAPTKLKTLDLSNNTALTDLSGLSVLTRLETLNLSGDKGVTDLSGLRSLGWLGTLDISGTGVTAFDALVNENGKLATVSLNTLTAHNLTLTSLSALAELQEEDTFWYYINWDFTGSTLPDTEENRTDIEIIQGKPIYLGEFIPPTIKAAPAPTPTPEPTEHGVVVSDCAHGRLAAEPAKAAEGDTVTITVTPDEGFEARSVSVTDADGATVEVSRNDDGTWTFVMPACDVTVTATFGCDGGAACPSRGLSDVDQTQWYHDAVDWAVSRGVMTGYAGTGLFGPDDELSRAQMAQILWNVEGKPVVDHPVDFGDVHEGDWHYQAIAWAASEGVFGGYADGSGLFGPDDALTREQAAAVLMRWAEARGDDVSARADLASYPDAGEVSDWAAESMSWAVAADVLRGAEREDGTLLLDPQGTANRAQTATLMMRLIG